MSYSIIKSKFEKAIKNLNKTHWIVEKVWVEYKKTFDEIEENIYALVKNKITNREEQINLHGDEIVGLIDDE